MGSSQEVWNQPIRSSRWRLLPDPVQATRSSTFVVEYPRMLASSQPMDAFVDLTDRRLVEWGIFWACLFPRLYFIPIYQEQKPVAIYCACSWKEGFNQIVVELPVIGEQLPSAHRRSAGGPHGSGHTGAVGWQTRDRKGRLCENNPIDGGFEQTHQSFGEKQTHRCPSTLVPLIRTPATVFKWDRLWLITTNKCMNMEIEHMSCFGILL